MDTLAPPIPFSAEDEARRRLEHTIDQDLSSLSFTASTSFASGTSVSTIPVARSAVARPMSPPDYPRYPSAGFAAADSTPRPKRAAASFAHTDFSEGPGASPTSTPGHHVSAATLGAGVFKRPGVSIRDRTGEEFDPDRSLGRLVGQLSKAMGEDRIGPKPVSPFVSPRSPHSPSPAPSTLPNLSFQLTRNEPPLSPPQSRTVSSSSNGSQRQQAAAPAMNGNAAYNAAAAANGRSSAPQPRRPALAETGRHNWAQPPPTVPAAVKDKGWMKAPTIVPVVVNRPNNNTLNTTAADITGMTGLLATPAKGAQFEELNKNGAQLGHNGANVDQGLSTLQARLRALETENGVSRRRINELEAEVARARQEVANASRDHAGRLSEVEGEKTALEELVSSLRENLKRLTVELEENKALVSKLRMAAQRPPSPVRYNDSVRDDISELRKDVERLSQEVVKLNQIAEAGLAERTRSREQRSLRINALDLHDQDEIDRVSADVNRRAVDFASPLPSQLRQGLHATAAVEPRLMPPSAGPTTRVAEANTSNHNQVPSSPSPPTRTRTLNPVVTIASPTQSINSIRSAHSEAHSQRSISTTSSGRRRRKERKDGPDSPFPSIRAEDEHEFFSPRRAAAELPRVSSRRDARDAPANESFDARDASRIETNLAANETVRAILTEGNVPPQTVLARVIHELEDDFSHYKQLYCELADQYKVLDAASVAAKRHVLAEHLKEVIDTLEQKADQIAALYSLLHFEDRQERPSTSRRSRRPQPKSARDLWRAVRESLPEDARRRLEADGLFRD